MQSNDLGTLRPLALAGLVLLAAGAHPVQAQTWLASGFDHACGLTSSGAAYCWGSNHQGEIGVGLKDSILATPRPVLGDRSFVSIVSGLERSCGLTRAGEAYCWGMNQWGALGDGTTQRREEPTPVVEEQEAAAEPAADSERSPADDTVA